MLIAGDLLRKLCSPLVYIRRRNGIVTYVGCSSKGIIRPFAHLWFSDNDTLEIIFCDSSEQAFKLESELLAQYGLNNGISRVERSKRKEILVNGRIDIIHALRKQGLSLTAIGMELGISRQRVFQILTKYPLP